MRRVIEYNPAWSHEYFQSCYIAPQRQGLIPDVTIIRILPGGEPEVFFETNAWGLKGPQPDSSRKNAVIWGDSVVFGIGRSWAEGLNGHQQDYLFMNGGVEGDFPEQILHRMLDRNARHDFALNIFFPGWHGIDRYAKRMDEGKLNEPDVIENTLHAIAQKRLVPGLVLCTLPSFLSAEDWEDDFSRFFTEGNPGDDDFFTFWQSIPPTRRNIAITRDYLLDRNAMLRRVAAKHNVPLIDLYAMLKFRTVEEARACFFDVCHIRPKAYPMVEARMMTALRQIQGIFA